MSAELPIFHSIHRAPSLPCKVTHSAAQLPLCVALFLTPGLLESPGRSLWVYAPSSQGLQ